MHRYPRLALPADGQAGNASAYDPLSLLVERVRERPAQLLLDSVAGQASYAEVLQFTRGIAEQMRRDGVRSGQLVALDFPPLLHFPFMLATFHEAAISCAFNESAFHRANVKPDLLYTLRDFPNYVARRVVRVDQQWIQAAAAFEGWLAPAAYTRRSATCMLFMSSGTTGVPKATEFSVANLMGRSQQISQLMSVQPFLSLLDVSAYVGLTSFFGQLMLGQTYLVPGNARDNLDIIRARSVRYIQGSVQQFASLLKALGDDLTTSPLTVDTVQVVGSPMPIRLRDSLVAAFSCEVHARYGTTEGGLVSLRLQDADEVFDAGFVIEGIDLEVLGHGGTEVEFGQEGSIRYRGEFTVPAHAKDGWFYPGDRGILFSDGRLLITGRDGESINFGGQKLSPVLVEEFVLSLDHVTDAAAFTITDDLGVQHLAVALVGTTIELAEVERLLKIEFGAIAPRRLHLVDRIPRTDMGKPMRNLLSEQLPN